MVGLGWPLDSNILGFIFHWEFTLITSYTVLVGRVVCPGFSSQDWF